MSQAQTHDRFFLPKRLPGVAFESLADLHEVHDMLSNRVESWTEQWKREGLEQGLERGRQETCYLLTRLAHHRFGSGIATQAEPLLTSIADPVQLVDLGDVLLVLSRRHGLAARPASGRGYIARRRQGFIRFTPDGYCEPIYPHVAVTRVHLRQKTNLE